MRIAQELVKRAESLKPALAARATEADNLRRLPDATVADLHAAEFFKIVQPARWGGLELSPSVLFDVQIALASACGSTGWVTGVLGVHTWQLALFPEKAQEEVWGENPNALISSSYAPNGKVERVDGGYRITGRWTFSSGCDFCDWAFLGGFVPPDGPDARPDMRTFLLPKSDYRIDDTWFVSGLKASGSKDIVVDGAFVPEHRTHKLIDGFKLDSPGNAVNRSPIYRLPFGQIHVRSVSSPAIGVAEGALATFRERTASRISAADKARLGEDPSFQGVCAEGAAELDLVRLCLSRNFNELNDRAEAAGGNVPEMPLDRRVRFRYDSAQAADRSMKVVDRLFTQSGGQVLRTGDPLGRAFQDVHAIRAHYANNPELPGRNLGRTLLGGKNQDYFV